MLSTNEKGDDQPHEHCGNFNVNKVPDALAKVWTRGRFFRLSGVGINDLHLDVLLQIDGRDEVQLLDGGLHTKVATMHLKIRKALFYFDHLEA